jgi:very-short-patch-repair endonuclease
MARQTPNARRLRRDMTPAEAILWRELRNRRFGNVKFRRQQPLDHYIADFFCAEARLVIELGGDSHMGKEERDARRQEYIERLGIRVIRFWNCEVYDELPWVLDCIGHALGAALGSARREASVLPSPLAGEGGGASPPGEG